MVSNKPIRRRMSREPKGRLEEDTDVVQALDYITHDENGRKNEGQE
jgi:hypothetical protein